MNAILAYINAIDELLNGEFFNFLATRSHVKHAEDMKGLMLGLNAVENACKYLLTLKQDSTPPFISILNVLVEVPSRTIFKKNLTDVQKIVVLLEGFLETERKLRALHQVFFFISLFLIIQTNFDLFFMSGASKLQILLERATSQVNYELSEQQLSSNAINDPWIQQFLIELQHFFAPIRV